MIPAAEIKKRLDELNLTLHPQERNKKRRWFFQNNIRIFTYNQHVCLETKMTLSEITSHMLALKAAHRALKNVFKGCKHENIVLLFVDGAYKNKSEKETSVSLYYAAMANAYADVMRTEKKWFKEKKLIVKLVETGDISDFVFLGTAEITAQETKRKEEE